jgi:hypothetical protein
MGVREAVRGDHNDTLICTVMYRFWQHNCLYQCRHSDLAADLQEQLNRFKGFDGLPNGGHARMYSTRAVVASVKQFGCGLTELWLDGGSTHHVVRDPSLFSNRRASQVNNVLVAGGEEHHVNCCGDMLIESPQGSHVFQEVLCVPTFIVKLLSTPQLDTSGIGVQHSNRRVTICDDKGEFLTGRLQGGLCKLDCTSWIVQCL